MAFYCFLLKFMLLYFVLGGNMNKESKKMLLKLKKEIEQMEYYTKHPQRYNAKMSFLKSFKISLKVGQLIVPYALCAGIVFSIFSSFFAVPFQKNKYKIYSETLKEYDSFGNIRYEQQYGSYDIDMNITYYSEWKNLDDGMYFRDIKVYSIKDISLDVVLELVNKNDKDLLLKTLDEPIQQKVETKNNLSEEELSKGPYLKALIHTKEDDYVETYLAKGDFAVTTLYIIASLFCCLVIYKIRGKFSNFDFEYDVERIKKQYQNLDVSELSKKLEIRKSNYDRFTK